MSAICGILSLADRPPPLDLLARMMKAMEKHGPDGSGSWHDGRAALGHQMRHVTPESLDERLPLQHSESGIALTMNGRLDNREDLLRTLGLSHSTGMPDSGLVIEAYQRWGKNCVDHLVGEFAFAIWDVRNRCLHCCTDPMGVRPLFYTEVPGQNFAFASEVEPLLSINGQPGTLDDARLAMLGVSALSVYLEPEVTCFKNIFRIPAATVLSVGEAGKTVSEYWAPDPAKRLHLKTDAECREAFREVFTKAVKARLRSAFPVASLLSGGLDSSAIVSTASRVLANENKNLITLSSVPMPAAQGRVTDERKYIDLFRDVENLDMNLVSAPESGPFDQLDELVTTASLCSYSYQHFLYTAFVRAAGQKNARVILDGDGGELAASGDPRGYMGELLRRGRWKTLLRELRRADADQKITWSAIKRRVVRPLVPYSMLKSLNRHPRYNQAVAYPLQAAFVQDTLGQVVVAIEDQLNGLLAEHPDHRRNMVRDMLHERDDIRQRSHAGFIDYHKAGFSYPYLDKRVLEFGLAVDGKFKYRDGSGRQLLRLGLEGFLPEKILSRTSKAPFSPDYHLRYQRGKAKAREIVEVFSRTGNLDRWVNFGRIFEALESTPDYRSDKPMRVDYDSQFLVPRAIYLCYFLSRFGN